VSQTDVPREILAVHGLHKQLGIVVVADDVNLTIAAGSIVGMVGPNGAGKTTMLSMLNGDIRADSGTITFNRRDVTRMTTAARARLGLARTYQIPRPFVGLTVFEHALLAAQQAGGFRGSEASDRAGFAVQICGMTQLANVAGSQLRLLDRKRLEIARAISGGPSLVLLDEVAGGLNDSEVARLTEVILALREDGLTFLWVEHVVRALVATADRMVCLSGGRLISQGTPIEVLNDPVVLESYFGSTTLIGTD
jgi:branched-chain amino acid transport system ATP-binding protein